ncbi:succinate dehydrogenase [ubiquinone] cytochrome b small subunit, mitochondrial [Anthonomus grandis grandis]|uniref:succinate dehydrogenase [ubiquinone] cytochrome b small subunit, mitochondrial n=1 Tax=Anthonomus grandis grandis TaxID=2921223 RepID=UPI002165C350|nr:succinate dehydrogenase [ubiquinone] cytochrome b small subunit, mitochondrial [Anthonomus grandis grandis]
MALSLMLRNGPKFRGLAASALPRCSFQIQKTQNFTHLVVKTNTKPLSLANKCKLQFINVAQQTKRNMSMDHGKLWTIEKIVSVLLLGIVPATFFTPHKIYDHLFAVLTVLHFHWGFEAIVVDYIRPILLGPLIPKLAMLLLYVVSITTLGGLIYFNETQIGIGCAFRRLWALTGTPCDNEDENEKK